MTEPTPAASRHKSHSGDSFITSPLYLNVFRPILNTAMAILLLIAAHLFHAGMLVAVFGALCIILLTASKIWKLQVGIFLSMVCLVLMIMINLWHWADNFFIAVYSGTIVADKSIFLGGLAEGVITLTTVWFYHKLLKKLNIHISHEWFVKKSQLKFLKLLFFFQMFLVIFWITGFTVLAADAGSHHNGHKAALIAVIIALPGSVIPALVYLFRNRDPNTKHHHRRHRHHHSQNQES